MDNDTWEAILNSKILFNHFRELCVNFSPPYREISLWANRQKAESNSNLIFFLKQTERLIREGKIHHETFKNEIKKMKDLKILHVEILWYLEFFRIMTLPEFILFHESISSKDVIEHIAQQVFVNFLDQITSPSEVRRKMLSHYIKTILECLRHGVENRENSFCENFFCLSVTSLKEFYGCKRKCDAVRCLEISHLEEFLSCEEFDCELIKIFFKKLCTGILDSSSQTMKSAFKIQETVKNNVKDKLILQFFTTMSKYCDLNFMIAQLQTKLLETSKGVDWSHMFCFITYIGTHFKDGWRELKTLTNVILQEAFQNLDTKLLSHAFLVARQGCFEKSNSSFPSYLQWFSSKFSSDSKKLINSKKACTWFFNFLTNISQNESAYYLKVHINRPPWVPNDCTEILQEYVELVKIQLSDLNISTELGICENPTTKSAAVFDVENVIKHFERTKDILNSVFQASMFCKDYYEKKFLVELLSKFEGKKSARHKLITKLHSLGKIPNSLYKVYKDLEKKSK